MKKRIVSIILAMVMVCMFAVPVFAANGLNANEEALLGKFSGVVDTYTDILGDTLAAQYKNEAENALTKVDLDAAACNDLSAAIDKVSDKLKGVQSKSDAGARLPEILKIVNGTANKYGMNVLVDGKKGATGRATVVVTLSGKSGSSATTDKVTSGNSVNQTGSDMTATVVIITILGAALVLGLVAVRKGKLVRE